MGKTARRATFSQRHAVLYDQVRAARSTSRSTTFARRAGPIVYVYDSLLSEYAVTGFEYGYSVADSSALVIWEAQFGDFSQWGADHLRPVSLGGRREMAVRRAASLCCLPHGYEGQGPEHSSARLERFLQLCAENNMIVCNLSTPANYFHALRRQVKRDVKKPLILMTPKSLLRHPQAVSTPEELTNGAFQCVIPADVDPDGAERLVFCGGKVYYDVMKALQDDETSQGKVAVARLEQLYPFPDAEVQAELERYKGVKDVVWVQEEPANMGAWTFIRYRFDELLEAIHGDCQHRIRYAGRPASASPATGSAKVHQLEQEKLIGEALALYRVGS